MSDYINGITLKRFISLDKAELKLLIIQYNLFHKLGEFVGHIKRDDPNWTSHWALSSWLKPVILHAENSW